ncbi:hypothetical protein [Pelagicoccus sp. SDUM812003]|uniref:hypothetical protein n=1 Tax=Pelagicoccus sp. SDUM812003 TaxID=3041267 RepID=UPI00280F1018|nr:hypothetical protein [Pelagicoccus sp. SDUM812003]MDQ8203846.1 hypothetical protein [Pelagicoccus sp. SDUM812003]
MNPLDGLPLWRALRRFSLTFAVIFASSMLGFSVVKLLRKVLGELSVPWLALWIGPIVLVSVIAKKEQVWIPDFTLRKRIAWGIVIASLAMYLIWGSFLKPKRPEPVEGDAPQQYDARERERHGPKHRK